MEYETRPQMYDETIRMLQKKDCRGIAEFLLPTVKGADEILIEHAKLSVPDMREMDFLTKVHMGEETFIFHAEFESAYKSNAEMIRRMLRYLTYIRWSNELPIYQVLVILKKPQNVVNIESELNINVHGLEVLNYKYKVIKAYELHKNDILKVKKEVLYPLRIFMRHDEETDDEHIQECLRVVEVLPDKDYYFLTLECIKKIYEKTEYAKYRMLQGWRLRKIAVENIDLRLETSKNNLQKCLT